jgi:hypothetical protein
MSRLSLLPLTLVLFLTLAGPGELVTRFWASLTDLWSENGCTLDPNGGCGG